MKEIQIKCKGTAYADINEFEPTQGDLKFLSPENKAKLRADIIERGFSFPLFVWPDGMTLKILDGHQRLTVLRELELDGYRIPHIPYCVFTGETIEEAMSTLLQATSQYGITTEMGLAVFIEQYKLDPNSIKERVEIRDVNWANFAERWNQHPDHEPAETVVSEHTRTLEQAPQFIISIYLESENQMQSLFEEMNSRGMKCKMIT